MPRSVHSLKICVCVRFPQQCGISRIFLHVRFYVKPILKVLEFQKPISRKIWMAVKSWNFHSVYVPNTGSRAFRNWFHVKSDWQLQTKLINVFLCSMIMIFKKIFTLTRLSKSFRFSDYFIFSWVDSKSNIFRENILFSV